MNLPEPITVIETPSFLRDAKKVLDENEQTDLISFLALNPTAGDLLKGTGGVRKVRWAREDEGKSGGYRVIYFFYSVNIPLFALNIFAKNEKANVSQAERNELKKLTSILVGQYETQGAKL
jgi:hypothetical protein